jgi:hypothetical protein
VGSAGERKSDSRQTKLAGLEIGGAEVEKSAAERSTYVLLSQDPATASTHLERPTANVSSAQSQDCQRTPISSSNRFRHPSESLINPTPRTIITMGLLSPFATRTGFSNGRDWDSDRDLPDLTGKVSLSDLGRLVRARAETVTLGECTGRYRHWW